LCSRTATTIGGPHADAPDAFRNSDNARPSGGVRRFTYKWDRAIVADVRDRAAYAVFWQKQRTYFWAAAALLAGLALNVLGQFTLRGTWAAAAISWFWVALLFVWVVISRKTTRLLCPRCGHRFSIKSGENRPRWSWSGIPKECANCGLPRGARADPNAEDIG
jgi:hypothetical protein